MITSAAVTREQGLPAQPGEALTRQAVTAVTISGSASVGRSHSLPLRQYLSWSIA